MSPGSGLTGQSRQPFRGEGAAGTRAEAGRTPAPLRVGRRTADSASPRPSAEADAPRRSGGSEVQGAARSPDGQVSGLPRSPTFSVKGRKRVWAASQKQLHLKCYRKIIYGSFWRTQLSRSHSLWVPDGRGSAVTAGARAAGAGSSQDEASWAARAISCSRWPAAPPAAPSPRRTRPHPPSPVPACTCIRGQDQRGRLRQEPLTIWAPQSAPLSGVCFYYKYFIV